jgi:hypothetical protein
MSSRSSRTRKESDMEAVLLTLILVGILAVLWIAADRFGIDSRDAYGDDWARSASR